MDLFEYQGKSLYQKFNINHPNSKLIKNLNDLNDPINLNFPIVVKAQVQVGGRGKAGGIKVAKDINELTQYSEEILGMDIKGHKVEILLLEEASNILEEYYISFTLDRSEKKYLIMLSAKGGMDIEQVAEENPDDLVKFHVSPSEKLTSSTISELINKANLNKDHEESLSEIIENLYLMFTEGDCDLVEVNPLAITDNGVMALDSKVSLDMNAKYKHPYFDDFDPNNSFYRVLFRPGYSIQSRELTTLQSILQNQVENLARANFKQGSIVVPGELVVDRQYNFVKVSSFTNNLQITDYVGKKMTGNSSGITATVVNAAALTATDSATLFVKYESGGDTNTAQTFQEGETITADSPGNPTAIVGVSGNVKPTLSDAMGYGTAVTVKEGIYFINGTLVKKMLPDYAGRLSFK